MPEPSKCYKTAPNLEKHQSQYIVNDVGEKLEVSLFLPAKFRSEQMIDHCVAL